MNNNNLNNLVSEIRLFCENNMLNIDGMMAEEVKTNEVINMLMYISGEMESRIYEEHQKKYVTDSVEIEYIRFVYRCTEYIMNECDRDDGFEECFGKLFKYRHYGYAFFCLMDKKDVANERREIYSVRVQEKNEVVKKYKKIYKTAYLSLAEFYIHFFGKFSDNESAIKLLCKYFTEDILFDEEEQKKIIDGLSNHVKNAGDSGDLGYAFNGLEMIKSYISNLPDYMIDRLLSRYSCNEVVGRGISRKQIYTIISNTFLANKLYQYKFLYLDSILIVDMLRDICNEERKELEQFVIKFNLEKIPINLRYFKLEDNDGNRYESIIDSENTSRIIRQSNEETLFEVLFEEAEKEKKMVVVYRGTRYILENKLELDPTLSVYNRKFYLDLKKKLTNNRVNNYISYKLVYLNNYHGMKQQQFCFDKRFGYSQGIISFDDVEKERLPLNYSSNIMSIHAIVGKNGTGKTSLVNFLGDDFVNIMFKLEEDGVAIPHIVESINMQDVEFVVVFEMDEQFYYVSNTRIVQTPEKVSRYEPNMAGSIKRALSKVFYFSNKLDINETCESRRMEMCEEEKRLDVWGTKNYSEQRTLSQRIKWQLDTANTYDLQEEKKESKFFNRDLFYQLIFLRDNFDDGGKKLASMLWDDFDIDKLTLGDTENDKIIQTFIREKEIKVQELQNVFSVERTLQYFSSGQYAKFNFFAKLYWIVRGYSCNAEIIKGLEEQNKFYGDEVIEKEDSAIIFIDEGDLYYHPEWQRQYISDLCKIIKKSESCKIQIIIATNSPFILSDIFEDNLIFLSEKNNFIKAYGNTFGQNIHILLKRDFFMDYTIGEFAREKIVQVIGILETQHSISKEEMAYKVAEILGITVLPEQVYEQLYHFANSIGEDMYRRYILELIEKHMKNNMNVRINYLKMRQKEIEDELQKLERE